MDRLRSIASGLALAVASSFATLPARADLLEDEEGEVDEAKKKERTEWAAVPIIGGSTDIGFQFGAGFSIAKVGGGFRPYWWNMDVLLSTSVKGGPRGTEFVQQAHDMRWDIPGGVGGKVRLMPAVFFDKTVNSGYFGLGNDAPVVTDPNGQIGSRYQFKHQELRTRLNIRQRIGVGGWNLLYGWTLRYVSPAAYPESRLAIDAATRLPDGSPLVYGLEPLGIGIINGGVNYDTRNDEIVPTRGSYHFAALRFAGATPTGSGVRWMGLNIVLQKYHRLGKSPFILAGRLFVDLMAGNVPFYDMSQGGAFVALDMPGGPQGIRGVPNGRYSGLAKVIGNVELRTFFTDFRFAGSHFKIGASTFFDAGRVWLDYTFDNPRDGTGLGLKYGVGGGPVFTWDSTAIFRVDFAYSPDASAANPGFPIGIYVQEGFMF